MREVPRESTRESVHVATGWIRIDMDFWRIMNSVAMMKGIAAVGVLTTSAIGATSTQLVEGSFQSELVPSPVEYYALLPPGYAERSKPMPLVLNLHGGGGNRGVLERQRPRLDTLFETGEIPPMVVVTPSVTQRSFYMDYEDGSERWETFLVGPFLQHVREHFLVRSDRRGTLITGISMGGMGSLRIAFKHPELFGAVAAMEPGIEPISDFDDMRLKHRFWRGDGLMRAIYGNPVDREYWNANNPASIAERRAELIRESGLKIYVEAGDEDLFWLYEGAEYLHRVLYDQRIRHEYRLYYGADHVGRTMGPRTDEAFRFLGRTLSDPEPDPAVEGVRSRIDVLKRQLDEADHYGVDDRLIDKE